MRFLHYELNLGHDDIVRVVLDKQANVRLMDDSNFASYRYGRSHRFVGGLAKVSPIDLPAPHAGRWHLAIDLGGYAGTVRASVKIV